MNKNNILILLLFTGISYFFNAELNKTKDDVLTLMERKVNYRYKSIDNDFALRHEKYTNGITKCYDVTDDEIVAYYDKYGIEITPFGEKLLQGEYRCSMK